MKKYMHWLRICLLKIISLLLIHIPGFDKTHHPDGSGPVNYPGKAERLRQASYGQSESAMWAHLRRSIVIIFKTRDR